MLHTIFKKPVVIFFLLAGTILLLTSALLKIHLNAQEYKSDKEMAKLQKKWFGVKSWQADYNETFRSSKEWEPRPGIKITTEIVTNANGHYVLDEKQGGIVNITEWYGYGNGTFSSTTTVTLKAAIEGYQISVIEIIQSEGSGTIGNRADERYGASLDIDALTGVYGAGFDLPEGTTTTLTRKVEGLPTNFEEISKLPPGLRNIFLPMAMNAKDWATFDGDINDTSPMVGGMAGMPLFGDMDEPKEYQLPESGLTLQDSYNGKYLSRNWVIRPSGTGEVLILAKCDQNWLPEGSNSVKIGVKGKGWYGEEVKVRFTLYEITREPGTCLNSKDEGTELDLDFYHPDNSEAKFSTIESIKDGFIAKTAKPVMNTTITVAARDFGAWGKLKAEAGFEGLWQPILTEDGKPYITIPLDESGGKENQIADKFETDNNLAVGVDPLLDKECIANRGDGLSAYEEYRGFLIGRGNRHHRTDPIKPDLFIFPQTQRLRNHLRQIQNSLPADIKAHLIEKDQYKYHMVVNGNSNLHNIVSQHGIWVVERNIERGGVLGKLDGEFGSPKDCMFVAIDIAEHNKIDLGKKQYILNTIVHEIFHALNVRHHGYTHRKVNYLGEPYRAERDGEYSFSAALYHGVCSGDVSCVMSYSTSSFYEEAPGRIAMDIDGSPKWYEDTLDKKNYRHLCSQQTGTGAGENFQLGSAAVGECINAIQISDR